MSVSEPSLSAAIDSEALMANNNTAVCHKSLIETARLAFQIINSMRSEQQLEEIDANIQEIFLQSVEVCDKWKAAVRPTLLTNYV